jgi:DNA-binding NtrC family response regulator
MVKPVILLIDDDKAMLNGLMHQLRVPFRGEYTIEAVQSIGEARMVLTMLYEQNIPVKLIISDWLMPPDRTNNLLVEISEKYPEILLVMLSGFADEAAVEHAKQHAGLKAFIKKPWDEEDLVRELKSLLSVNERV